MHGFKVRALTAELNQIAAIGVDFDDGESLAAREMSHLVRDVAGFAFHWSGQMEAGMDAGELEYELDPAWDLMSPVERDFAGRVAVMFLALASAKGADPLRMIATVLATFSPETAAP